MLLSLVLTHSLLAAAPTLSAAPRPTTSLFAERYLPGAEVPEGMEVTYRDQAGWLLAGLTAFGLAYLPSFGAGLTTALFIPLQAALGSDVNLDAALLVFPFAGPFLLAARNNPGFWQSPRLQIINGSVQVLGAALVAYGWFTRGTYLVPRNVSVAPVGPGGSHGVTLALSF